MQIPVSEQLRWQLGETEYATIDPQYTRRVRYGTFYAHPAFRDRYDANQLCRMSCNREEVPDLLATLEECYHDLQSDFRKVSGYAPAVWEHLAPALQVQGWRVSTSMLMLFTAPSARSSNPDVTIRSVGPSSPDLDALYQVDGRVDRGFELARSQFDRLGGEYLIGHIDGRPACVTGWYVANRMARFRHVLTAEWARGRGCATTLIHHVQCDRRVLQQDGLAILVNEEGPHSLYHALGFRDTAPFWEARGAPAAHCSTRSN